MRGKTLLLAVLLLVLTVTEAHATALRDNLKGLRGFWVLVEMDAPDLEKDGLLNRDLLQARLELRLRQTGINIFSALEMSRTPGQPILMLTVVARRLEAVKGYTVSVLLGIIERVILDRDTTGLSTA